MAQPFVSKDPPSGTDGAALPRDEEATLGAKFGNVQITAVLARDALGPEYLATATDGSGRTFVLRMFPDMVLAADPEVLRQVLNEAKAASALKHPNLVRLIVVSRDPRGLYAVTEHGEGKRASDLLAERGPLTPVEAARLISGAAAGLEAVAAGGLTHRNVRPENIIEGADGQVRLAGIGLVRAVEHMQESRLGVPLAGPAYCSPELYQGRPLDSRTDVYSLGATLFHLLTGRPPYEADTSMQVLHKHCTAPVPDPRELQPELPEAFGAIIRRAMAKEPAERYATGKDMAAEVDRAAAEWAKTGRPASGAKSGIRSGTLKPTSAPLKPTSGALKPTSGTRAPAGHSSTSPAGGVRPVGGKSGWAVAALGIVLLGLAAAIIVAVSMRSPSDPPPTPKVVKPDPKPSPPPGEDPPLPEPVVVRPDPVGPTPSAGLGDEFGRLNSAIADAAAAGDGRALETATKAMQDFAAKARAAGDAKSREFADQADAIAKKQKPMIMVLTQMPPQGGPTVELFADRFELLEAQLGDGGGKMMVETNDRYSGKVAVRVTPDQKHSGSVPGWNYQIAEFPQPGEYRYLRFAWKKIGGKRMLLQICDRGNWGRRYEAGEKQDWQPAIHLTDDLPTEWTVVTRDLFADFGPIRVNGIALSPRDGEAGLFDHIYLGRTVEDLDKLPVGK